MDTTIYEEFQKGLPNREPQRYSIHKDREKVKQIFIRVFTKVLELEGVEFQWRDYYDHVVDWLHDNDGRGLALIGSKGTGKTIIMVHVIPRLFALAYNLMVPALNSNHLSTMTGADIKEFLKRKIFNLDELGRENRINMYGVEFDPIPMVLQEVESRKAMLWMTSNLTSAEIAERYGHHVWDRIKGNCKAVEFRDDSFRE